MDKLPFDIEDEKIFEQEEAIPFVKKLAQLTLKWSSKEAILKKREMFMLLWGVWFQQHLSDALDDVILSSDDNVLEDGTRLEE